MTDLKSKIEKRIEQDEKLYAFNQICEAQECCESCEELAKNVFVEKDGYGRRSYRAGAHSILPLLMEMAESLETYIKWASNEGTLDKKRADKAKRTLQKLEAWAEGK